MSNAASERGRGNFEANLPHDWGNRHGQRLSNIEYFADELGLTEQQLTSIKEKRFKTKKEAVELRSKIQIAELELKKLLQSDNPNQNSIKQKIEEISGLRSNLKFAKIQSRLELRNILSSEQLQKLKELRKERSKKCMHRGRPFRSSHSGRKFRANIERFADELGLTEEQLTTIQKKQFQTKKAAIELRSKIQIARLELRELIQSENPDVNTIKQKIEKIGELKSKLRFAKVQSRLEVRNTLTSEQLQKLKGLRQEQLKKRMHRRGLRDNLPGRRFKRCYGGIEPEGSFPELRELEGDLMDI
jgi:Spy/CpxP family protein refolding chaperone